MMKPVPKPSQGILCVLDHSTGLSGVDKKFQAVLLKGPSSDDRIRLFYPVLIHLVSFAFLIGVSGSY